MPTIDFFSEMLCFTITAKRGAITPTNMFKIPVKKPTIKYKFVGTVKLSVNFKFWIPSASNIKIQLNF